MSVYQNIAVVVLLGSLAAADEIQFNRDVRPILAENCFTCHGPDSGTREANLRFDQQDGLFGEVESGGKAVVPNDTKSSQLVTRIMSSDPDSRMPPADSGRKLTEQQIETIRQWIQQGAKWQGHWAFFKPQRAQPPAVKNEQWARGEVDRFILARLTAEGLQPSPKADKVTLIRRLSFDLTGLPPTSSEVDRFIKDASDQAYEKVVDRLLKSKHYGERMAMYWLDLVRYADSGGYHSDNAVSISPYRDYVIHALNDNVPFDQFTREQIAGDLLPNATIEQKVASGYNRLVKTTEEGGAQPGEYLVKMAADRLRTTSGAWMGITLGCAECHDHKYDPFTTKDFYSFEAIFADVQERGKYGGGGRREPELMVPSRQQAAEIQRIDYKIAELNKVATSKPREDKEKVEHEKKQIAQQIAKLREQRKAIEKQFTRTLVTVSVSPREVRILPRGNWLDRSGEIVQPAVPAVLPQPDDGAKRLTRLDLANWLTSRDNPLTARVFVNRLWKLLFGRGISKRLDDIGAQGDWPTHPQLLDWLAVEFMECGWDIKHMVKLLVMSNTYRQSSLESEKHRRIDPLNELYARQSRWRLDAEVIRDNSLAVSGLLVRKIGGRSVKPYQPAGYWSHLNFPTRSWKHDTGPEQYRRGLYTHWQRTFLHPSLLAFDAPTREECTAERPISNTPKGALTLLNDPTHIEAARVFAARLIREGGDDTKSRINWAWREALSRRPGKREVEVLAKLLDFHQKHFQQNKPEAEKLLSIGLSKAPAGTDPIEIAAWTSVARTIFNLNEMITRN